MNFDVVSSGNSPNFRAGEQLPESHTAIPWPVVFITASRLFLHL
jgi:hypothetical protein